ncbi:uncharacterized protein LOC128215032 [Mya arenaria]|uniref:uncharacterized protein LOC128215032 n=1 Tax=Mya arenaria TaxID=6604 RepID=UPI0022E0C244|nr:uncharacterized protein LOC128215032 [Mya arenaria]
MLLKCLILFVLFIQGCHSNPRHVNVIVRHQQVYRVGRDAERTHVRLSPAHEKLLELDQVKPGKFSSTYEHESFKYEPYRITRGKSDELNDIKPEYNYAEDDFNEGDSDDTEETFSDRYDKNVHLLNVLKEVESQLVKPPYINDEDIVVNRLARQSKFRENRRNKRAAREQWRQSLPGAKSTVPGANGGKDEPDVWDEVTDAELKQASYWKYRDIAKYAGTTLLSVACFAFLGICFIRDPVAFVFAFGTGCPCCLICCPCVRAFTDKFLNVKGLVKDSMNKYMPGVIVKEDGSLDHYEPTPEEVEILHELMEEIM